MKQLILTLTVGVTLCSSVSAQDDAPSERVRREAARREPFPNGTWSMEITGSYIDPIRFSDSKLYNVNTAIGMHLWDSHWLAVELQGYYADQPFEDTAVGGLGLLGRWHFLRAEQFTIFLDGGGSATYADANVPEFGTRFNFTGKAGFGATLRLRDDLHLIGGARYFHLSNGNTDGSRERNPSHDGVQFWAGVLLTF